MVVPKSRDLPLFQKYGARSFYTAQNVGGSKKVWPQIWVIMTGEIIYTIVVYHKCISQGTSFLLQQKDRVVFAAQES
jgi:hypothetical protein